MRHWRQKEQKRYNDIYKNRKDYGVSEFGSYSKIFPDIGRSKLSVIDLGCGAALMAKYYPSYTGVDISTEAIKANKERFKHGKFYVGSLDDLERWKGWKYDVAFINDVMEHVPKEMTGLVLKEMSNLSVDAFYFKIHRGNSNFNDSQGNLHRTQEEHEFWSGLLSNWFNIEAEYWKGNSKVKGYLSYFKCTKK